MAAGPLARVYVAGVGMTVFTKPGTVDYPDLVHTAVGRALADAGLAAGSIDLAVCGYVQGDSCAGQRALQGTGLREGVPVINVNNNCATGSTALYVGRQAILSSRARCVLVVGFDKMSRGPLKSTNYPDRAVPLQPLLEHMISLNKDYDPALHPVAAYLFGSAAREHSRLYGTTPEQYAAVAVKNSRHSALNPYCQRRGALTLEQVLGSRTVYSPLTLYQCCPTSDGAAAVVLCSEALRGPWTVELVGQSLVSVGSTSTCMDTVGYDMTARAAAEALGEAGLCASNVDVAEVHDCFSSNELISCEAIGLCAKGEGGRAAEEHRFSLGGRGPVVNPSGGLLFKGHPLGATGVAQCCEVTWQLRGHAGLRQVPGAGVGLLHNLGLGGGCCVTILKRTDTETTHLRSDPLLLQQWEKGGRLEDSRPYARLSKL